MKLIAVDNYARENVADQLVAENITDFYANFLAESANRNTTKDSDRYFKAVPDNHVLWRGMAELV